ILLPGSTPFAYEMLNSSRNARASCSLSWMLIPTNTTPRGRYACHAVSRAGASSRQGTHHDAQKLRNTTLPRRFSSLSTSPSKSGAPPCTPVCAPNDRAVHRGGVDLTGLSWIDRDGQDVLGAVGHGGPCPTPVVGAKDPVARGDVHHLRVRRIDGKAVDRCRGQTAHRFPTSEAVRISLKSFRRPGVEIDAPHACGEIDGREALRLASRPIV